MAGAALWRWTLAARALGGAFALLRAGQARGLQRLRDEALIARGLRRAGGFE